MTTGEDEKHWPRTVEEAVNRILLELPEKDKGIIRNTPSEFEMMRYHDSLGRWVRNTFGLWKGNNELLQSCGQSNPDGASSVILGALWNALQKGIKTDAS
jgi:hypothetical protein